MRLFAAIALGMLVALPVFAAEPNVGWVVEQPSGEAPTGGLDAPCTSDQGAVTDAQLGIQGAFGPQGPCIPGNPGDPADLVGMAFALASCQDGWVVQTNIEFKIADGGEGWHLYLWRDLGGIPFDACGLECAVATGLTTPVGPAWYAADWTAAACPCVTFNQEILYVGTIYVDGVTPPDWFVGREDVPGFAGLGFGNLSGNHGDWADLNDFGYGNKWGVENIIDTDCSGVPVEPSSWGAMKNLYR